MRVEVGDGVGEGRGGEGGKGRGQEGKGRDVREEKTSLASLLGCYVQLCFCVVSAQCQCQM